MGLTAIRVRNFKCFQDSGELRLAPLTLIFGKNNAGKSSLLQPLFLLRQTLDAPQGGLRLNLNGPLYRAGSFAELVHAHETRSRVCVDLGIEAEAQDGASIECGFAMEFANSRIGAPPASRFTIRFPGRPSPRLDVVRGRGAGGPYGLAIAGHDLGAQGDAGFRILTTDFFPIIGEEPPRVGRPSPNRQAVRYNAHVAIEALKLILNSMRMVGPFRRPPDRRYEYSGGVQAAADPAGEHVVDALIEDEFRRKKRGKRDLLKEVNRWLVGIGGVKLEPIRRLGRANIFEVRLRDANSGQWAGFADVGYGIGQAFSVLVEGLRTPLGGTFVVQEPEIHLHPDAQLAMADFLVYLAMTGRQVIVETHSEPILLRVRRAAIDGTMGAGAEERVSVVYVARSKSGASEVQQMGLDDLGRLEDWPGGFMEEATEERLALLEVMAHKAERGVRSGR